MLARDRVSEAVSDRCANRGESSVDALAIGSPPPRASWMNRVIESTDMNQVGSEAEGAGRLDGTSRSLEPLRTRDLTDGVKFQGSQVTYSGPGPSRAGGPLYLIP